MLWGGPWTSRWGGNEEQIKRLELKEVLGGVRIRAQMIDGYAQNCRVVIDGINGPSKKISDSELTELVAPWPRPAGSVSPALTSHLISLVPIGDWASTTIDAGFQQIFYTQTTPDRIAIQITAVPSYFAYHAAGTITQLDSWEIFGLKRFTNCKPVRNHKTWAKLEVSLVTALGIRTLTLSVDGVAVASGTRPVLAGNGTINLNEENSSGIEDGSSVYLTYSADFTDGTLIARFPAQYRIHHRSTGAFGGGDFPRVPEQTLYDDGRKSVFNWSGSTLTAGTRYIVVHQVDEDGNESNGTANATIVLYAEPLAAGVPSYLSGSSLNTIIQFAASLTANAVYNIYDSLETGILDMDASENLLLYSEELTNAAWTKSAGATVTGGEVSPQGPSTAQKIVYATAGDSVSQGIGLSMAAVKALVASLWIKGTPGSPIVLLLTGATSGQVILQPEITGEWQRVFLCAQAGVGSSPLVGNITVSLRANFADTIYVFGFMAERSGSVHQYRKTTGATVTTTARLQHDVGVGNLTQAMTALSAGFTGKRHIVVKSAGVASATGPVAFNNAVESKAVKELTIDYVAGVAQVAAIPPEPSVIERLVSISGRTISVKCSFMVIEQLAAATKIKLWITPVGTPVNFAAAPDGTVTLGSRVGKVVNATVSATAGGDGAYMVAVRTETAGGVRSTNTDEYGPYELTTTLPADPEILVRGGAV
jgi:hypothetical protein